MATTLSINNFDKSNIIESSRLAADVLANVNAIPVQSVSGASANLFAIVGDIGSEQSELMQIQSVSGNTITFTGNLQSAHSKYDNVTFLRANQVKIYRTANVNGSIPPDANFTVLVAQNIDFDQGSTIYVDYTGGSDYWYKFTYYNSITTSESSLSDSNAARGGDPGAYCSLWDIRLEAGFRYADFITDNMIDKKRKAAQDEINGTLHGYYTVPFAAPVNDFIRDICVRLSAGLLQLEQYGMTTQNGTANGQNKVDKARADLYEIATKQKVLVDYQGNSLALPGSTGGISGWPNSSTDATSANGVIDVSTMDYGQDAGHAFQRKDILGYQGRKY